MLKKKFGQNFLTNQTISEKIVELEKINNENILEIGTGNLSLTKFILDKKPKKFVSIEIDKDLKKNYNNDFLKYIIFDDAIKFDEMKFFNNNNFSIISNLPFNISSNILVKWIYLQNNFSCIKSMTLMFQKELADRIVSSENSKKYGRLSVIAQAFFIIEKKLEVSKEDFSPKPKVDAVVLKFIPHKKNKIKKQNLKKLEMITSLFFGERRKKNKQKIKKIFKDNEIIDNHFDKLFDKRPENICKEIYFKMAEII